MRKCAFGKCAVWTLVAATGLIVAGSFLGFGPSHWRAVFKDARQAAMNHVPTQFEIDRLRNEINSLDQDESKNFDTLATETVAVKRLQNELDERQAGLEKRKTVVLQMRRDLNTGAKTVVYDRVEYTADELKDNLVREYDTYLQQEAALKAKKEELKARQEGLNAGRAKIDAMRSAKEKLLAELAKIEAEHKRLQVAETRNEFQVDDSRLSRIKGSMKQLHDRVEAAKLANEMKSQYAHQTSIAEKVEVKIKGDKVLKDIDAHFGKDATRVSAEPDDEK
jgi:chromosome segregation ATPase